MTSYNVFILVLTIDQSDTRLLVLGNSEIWNYNDTIVIVCVYVNIAVDELFWIV